MMAIFLVLFSSGMVFSQTPTPLPTETKFIKFIETICNNDEKPKYGLVNCGVFKTGAIADLKKTARHVNWKLLNENQVHVFSFTNTLCLMSNKDKQTVKIPGMVCDVVGGMKGKPKCGASYCGGQGKTDDSDCYVERSYNYGARIQENTKAYEQVVSELNSGMINMHIYKDIKTGAEAAPCLPLGLAVVRALMGDSGTTPLPPKPQKGLIEARDDLIKNHEVKRDTISAATETSACFKKEGVWKDKIDPITGKPAGLDSMTDYSSTSFCQLAAAYAQVQFLIKQLMVCEWATRADEKYTDNFIRKAPLMDAFKALKAGMDQGAADGGIGAGTSGNENPYSCSCGTNCTTTCYGTPTAATESSFNAGSAASQSQLLYESGVDGLAEKIIKDLSLVSNASVLLPAEAIKDSTTGEIFSYKRCGEDNK